MSAEHVADVFFDGAALAADARPGARRFSVDTRCLAGPGVAGAFAHVCALADERARIPFDQPEVQHVRRDALAWWLPLLGDALVCVSTLSLDSVLYGGAVTVARDPRLFGEDPFARLFPGTVVRTDLFAVVSAPPGPLIERTAGAPWPGGAF